MEAKRTRATSFGAAALAAIASLVLTLAVATPAFGAWGGLVGNSDSGLRWRYPTYEYAHSRWVTVGVDVGVSPNQWYYMDSSGYAVKGWSYINGAWYHFGPSCIMDTGWKVVDGVWYYFGGENDGAMRTGWNKIGDEWFYFDPSGAWRPSSWVYDGGWWYSWPDGTWPADSWQKIGGYWYHFDGSGYMQTGWLRTGGDWYYLNPDGSMAQGWKYVDGSWYYLDLGSGAMKTGWFCETGLATDGREGISAGDAWYYLGSDGAMRTGWQYVNGSWYYLEPSGRMATGMKTVGGVDYYLDDDNGNMGIGWIKLGESSDSAYDNDPYLWVYAGPSGALASAKWVGEYWVGEDHLMARSQWVDSGKCYVNGVGKRMGDSGTVKAKDGLSYKYVTVNGRQCVDIVGCYGENRNIQIPYAIDGLPLNNIDLSYCGVTGLRMVNTTGDDHAVFSCTKLDCSHNEISDLRLSDGEQIGWLDCSWNRMNSLVIAETAVRKLECQHNPFMEREGFGPNELPSTLTYLDCSTTMISWLDVHRETFPNLERILAGGNRLNSIMLISLADEWGSAFQ